MTKILLKIFAKGFFRVHSGQLLFFSATIVIYCFYINVLKDDHLTKEERILNNLKFVLTFLSSLAMMIIVFAVWLTFTVKSWIYIEKELHAPSNEFLFYSATAFSKFDQFKSWFIVQLAISLPLLIYWVFCTIIGAVFGYYIVPGLIILFVFLLAGTSAGIYTRMLNKRLRQGHNSILDRLPKWEKPGYSLLIYFLFDKEKLALILTKLASFILIYAGTILLNEQENKFHISAVICLMLAISHAYLVFACFKFQKTKLSLMLNLPISRFRIFLRLAVSFALILLPELIYFSINFSLFEFIAFLILCLSLLLLMWSSLLYLGLNMRRYLYTLFLLFISVFVAIQFRTTWFVIPILSLIAAILFYRKYYRQSD